MRRPFSATTECPYCKNIATHWIEEPEEPPEIIGMEEHELTGYGGMVLMVSRVPKYSPGGNPAAREWNTSNCSVIRTCRLCRHKWGED